MDVQTRARSPRLLGQIDPANLCLPGTHRRHNILEDRLNAFISRHYRPPKLARDPAPLRLVAPGRDRSMDPDQRGSPVCPSFGRGSIHPFPRPLGRPSGRPIIPLRPKRLEASKPPARGFGMSLVFREFLPTIKNPPSL